MSAKDYAMNLFFAGDQLLREYHYGQAAKAFADGLKGIRDNGDMNDPVYAKYYNLYQDCLAKDNRLKELFPVVQSVAMNEKPLPLETIEKALRGAEEMVALQPNNTDSQIYKSRLEQKIKKAQRGKENKALADALWKEGEGLFHENRYTDSLGKFKESLKLWSNQERQKYVDDLDRALAAKKAKAKKLRDEGEALQNKGKLREAIGKYQESLKHWPDPALENHISQIEASLRNQEDEQAKKACAKKNRDEGAALQKQGRLQEALAKYRESYNCMPTQEMDQHIKIIENTLAQSPPSSSVQVEGLWEFDGTDLTLTQKGSQLTGKYTEDNGELTGIISGNVFEGYWIEDNSARRCSSAQNGRYYWGRFRIEFDGNRLTGRWSYCEDREFQSRIWRGTKREIQGPDSASLSGTWTAKCTGGDSYTAKVTQSGLSFEAQVDTEHYRGTISGNRINGKSTGGTDTITGDIISNNELRVVLKGYIGKSPITNNCTLTRGAGDGSKRQDGKAGNLSVKAKNASAQNVHIYPQGGKCSPDNKLAPGQGRTITIPMPSDGILKFCAGRNGKDIECKKQGIDPGYSGYTYTVIFDEKNPFNRLLIHTGLK